MFVGCVILFMGSVYGFSKEGFSAHAIGGMLLFGWSGLLFLFQDKWDRLTSNFIERKRKSFHCQIQKDHFFFPRGYYFKNSSLGKKKRLKFTDIDEIRTNTIPHTALINRNEIIFLVGLSEEDIKPLSSKIPFTQPQDNWMLICDEFLDTEYSEKEKELNLKKLAESGISEEEVKKIRKRISFRMLVSTYLTLEWVYYGQWDVMRETWPVNKKKYWWTMDIALRKK